MHRPLLTTDYLDRAVELYGNEVGVVANDGTEFTYAELGNRIDRLSNVFREWGVEKGDRVALLSPNSHYFIETLYATMQLGALFVPLNFRLQPEEYEYLVNDCEPSVLIADYDYAEKVQHLRNNVGINQWVAYEADSIEGDWLDYETVISEASDEQLERLDISEDDDATILYTSGTTGDPKGVVHTHRIQHYHALIHAHHVEFEDDDTMLWTSPMFHINGWGHIYGLTGIGGKHVILRDFGPETVFERINEHDVSFLGGAPTVLNMLLEHYEEADIPASGDNPVRAETAASPRRRRRSNGLRTNSAGGSSMPMVLPRPGRSSRRATLNGRSSRVINTSSSINPGLRRSTRKYGLSTKMATMSRPTIKPKVKSSPVATRYWTATGTNRRKPRGRSTTVSMAGSTLVISLRSMRME